MIQTVDRPAPATAVARARLALGPLRLASNLVLSPLAGYTNLPFRLVIRELGGVGLVTTDLVNARSLIERNRKALKLVESNGADRPMAIQLFGSVREEMVEAARICEGLGAVSVDVNMGCPVRKVCQVGGGSSMMTRMDETARLVAAMVAAVEIPVTCKMRLGWDDRNLTAPELARALEEAGAAAITVHGRTRAQGFEGRVNLPGIRRVVEAVRLPVIGNGDVTSPEAAVEMLSATGCAGVGIGRGAFYNPWIFAHTWTYLQTGERRREPSFEERIRVMTRHLDLMVEVFGEDLGCRMFRKVAPWYAKRFGPSSFFNKRIVQLAKRAEYEEILDGYRAWRARFLDEDGELQPRFRQPDLAADFDYAELGAEPAVARREAIPVPKGPQEYW
ncbi:MAG: tRNA dihydrouridine synthase DusB [Verrucomicrobiota bacterium]